MIKANNVDMIWEGSPLFILRRPRRTSMVCVLKMKVRGNNKKIVAPLIRISLMFNLGQLF